MALGTFTLTGSWKKADGSNATGKIILEPTTAVFDGATNNVIVPKVPLEIVLSSGAISQAGVAVLSEVDTGYTYTVTEVLDGVNPQDRETYVLSVPSNAAGTTKDIADLITATPPATPMGVTMLNSDGVHPTQDGQNLLAYIIGQSVAGA